MQDSARIQSVIELWDAVLTSDENEDIVIKNYFRQRRYIGSKDRKAISQILWDAFRFMGRIRSLKREISAREAIISFLFYQGNSKERIRELFSCEKYGPVSLTYEETDFLINLPENEPSVLFELPDFLKNEIKEETLKALSKPAFLDVRVNTLKTDRKKVLELFSQQGLKARQTPLSPIGIRLEDRVNLKENVLFKNGWIDIQDEGSQIVSLLTRASQNQNIIDWCAGAGGKTLAMASMMENTGKIDAVDFYPHRMKDLPERLERASVNNVRLLSSHQFVEKEYDTVLVDAPCSGTGTWRRFPLLRWRTDADSVQNVTQTQKSILNQACEVVKKDGRLIYITCSVLKSENTEQVETFLKNHPDFILEDLSSVFQMVTNREKSTKTISLLPDIDETDGFFIASLKKIS